MADTVTPTFNILRDQIAAFVKDPRTVRDIEAFIRMVREQVPLLLGTKVDDSRIIGTDGTLTGGGDLTSDLTLGIDLTSEAERARDTIGTALTDSATIDFTANDGADTITADLKNTAVTAGSYGDATNVGSFTVDAQGRLTAAANVPISLPAGYTDEQAQDAVGAMVDASLTYVDATPLLQRAALTGDVTASAGSNATTIANSAVTLAKIANAAANSKLLGSGASGGGSPYAEITLGSNLSMSGTTLNVSGGSGGGGGPVGLGVTMMMAVGTYSS